MGRRWLGIDISERYIEYARQRMRRLEASEPLLLVGRAKYPGKDELAALAGRGGRNVRRSSGSETSSQELRSWAPEKDDGQMLLV
jgi:hypothetical protein